MRVNLKLLGATWVLCAAMAGCSSTPDTSEDGAFVSPDGATEGSSETFGANAGSNVTETASKGLDAAQAELLKTRVVLFDFDSSSIRPEFYGMLKAHAAYLVNNTGTKVRIEGHADERGTREYNMALGERRAKVVVTYLRAQGVKSSQLEAVSYGEEKPVDYGHNEMAWSKNRRAAISY